VRGAKMTTLKSERPTVFYLIPILIVFVFFEIYLAIDGYFGCNPYIGLGVATSDGECENYLYGYSIFFEIADILLPIVVGYFVFLKFGLSKLLSIIATLCLLGISMYLSRLIFGVIFS
jgi:hypothetical protein